VNKPTDLARIPVDHDDIDTNVSSNEHFSTVLNARLSRRSLLRGSAASAASALLGSIGLSACGGSSEAPVATSPVAATPAAPSVPAAPAEKLLGFTAVSKSLADAVVVPAGYTATVLYALGDPLTAATPAFKNDGTDGDMEHRAGDHHDGMEFFPLSASGTASTSANERGLLAMNHEATTDEKLSSFFLHPNGGTTTLPRPAAEVDKEVALHGLSVVELRKSGAKWEYLKDSPFNRRVTALTEIEIAGPLRGNALAVTKYSGNGTHTRGTLNNCGTGKTPWNTYLSGEENFAGYFTRAAADDVARA
jgi:secreted PhoX family phosphatase